MKREFPEMGYSKSTYRNSLFTTKKNIVLDLSYRANFFWLSFQIKSDAAAPSFLLDNSSKKFHKILGKKCFGSLPFNKVAGLLYGIGILS